MVASGSMSARVNWRPAFSRVMKSLKEPSLSRSTRCPFTVTVAPGSVLPFTCRMLPRVSSTSMDSGGGEVYLPWFWWPIMFVLRHLPERIFMRLKI